MPGATGGSSNSQNSSTNSTATRHFDLDQDKMDNGDEQRVLNLLRWFKDVNTSLVIKNRRLIGELTKLNMLVVDLRVENSRTERQLDDLRTLGPDISQEIDRLTNLADERFDRELEEDAEGEDNISKGTKTSELTSEDEEETGDAVEEEEEDDDLRADFDRRLQLELRAERGDDVDSVGNHNINEKEDSQSLFAVFNQQMQIDDNASTDQRLSPPSKLMRVDQDETAVGGGTPPKPELKLSAKKEKTTTASESSRKQSKNQQPKKKGAKVSTLICVIDGCGNRFKDKQKLKQHQFLHSDKYQCQDCQRRCQSFKSLEQHRRIHTKECPFKCEWEGCNKQFTQKGNMKSHLKSVHGVEH